MNTPKPLTPSQVLSKAQATINFLSSEEDITGVDVAAVLEAALAAVRGR